MTARISLALTLHNHQPIGNFGCRPSASTIGL